MTSPLDAFSADAKARIYACAVKYLERHEDATVAEAMAGAMLVERLLRGMSQQGVCSPLKREGL